MCERADGGKRNDGRDGRRGRRHRGREQRRAGSDRSERHNGRHRIDRIDRKHRDSGSDRNDRRDRGERAGGRGRRSRRLRPAASGPWEAPLGTQLVERRGKGRCGTGAKLRRDARPDPIKQLLAVAQALVERP